MDDQHPHSFRPSRDYIRRKPGHKRTRFGCQKCRARRIKCDEGKPACSNCKRYRSRCTYDRVGFIPSPVVLPQQFASGSPEARVAHSLALDSRDLPFSEPDESRERRLLEAKLMFQYTTQTGKSIELDEKIQPYLSEWAPKLAFSSDGLLYCIYALAALHCKVLGDALEPSSTVVHHKYLSMGLREHNAALADITVQNGDTLCITSTILRICSYVLLQDRVRQPYTPPVEFLMMNASTMNIVDTVLNLPGLPEESITRAVMSLSPVGFDLGARFDPANGRGLETLLERDADDAWNTETHEAYETTVCYLGGMINMVASKDRDDGIRRAIMFPMMVQERFIELVQQQEPRALVILAHYFSILHLIRDRWWIGESGGEEVRAIAGHLPRRWRELCSWPLRVVETGQVAPLEGGETTAR